jgi:hypothetical protein
MSASSTPVHNNTPVRSEKSPPPEDHTKGQNTVQNQQPNIDLSEDFARSQGDTVAADKTGIALARHTFIHISAMPLP